ncbi:MAG TPA: glycerate kinase [Puia sp.]|nr:glycerate kinase [Puia sp.]
MKHHFLIAPNAFKNSLSAGEAALAIRNGLLQSGLQCTCECFPIGDGGDGTVDLIIERLGGNRLEAEARDPLGRKITTYFGLIASSTQQTDLTPKFEFVYTNSISPQTHTPLDAAPPPIPKPAATPTALIEMANASGIRLLTNNELNPLRALSNGTGDLIRAALDNNARRIIIGMGGSATVDGGTGILEALGARFLNKKGEPLKNLPETLIDLASIDTSGLDPRLSNTELIVLCDVDNSLLGPSGSAAIFGPQKGATPQAVEQLDKALSRLSEIVLKQTGRDMTKVMYGGTAGGAAAGLYGLLDATLVKGIDHFLEITDFDKALSAATCVITGEGSIDEQTLQGKGPFGVASRAKGTGLPVIGLAGKVPLEPSAGLKKYFDMLLAIGNEPTDLASALMNTDANLTRTAEAIGQLLNQFNTHPKP